ncbi:pyridoxamine 5'-phosphate oxidase family protein [Gordonia hydrophobica]|uniref:Pyridoxamine 5'-phosphate oxidase family protein n=1 Tax=Gordonia hydrophobica TaxID=40516 RepID=A0ABZ2TZE0_9ACTN|nr:pyridoxamine 5'-phosphate oxidase family protein [Gordonia hydrophobica]MBM7365855.1 nitroimidazol reductase NimA-like FMN-containing flavoprotein (pyridoxamine 5'-phosphate oxidase superfamily) [Gordonia hydrophobica]
MTEPTAPGGQSRPGSTDIERLAHARLTAEAASALLAEQTECTFCFLDRDGAPAAVVLSFAVDDGRFWFTSVDGRVQVRGVQRDPRVSIVVSGTGTGARGRQMLAVKGHATVHRDIAGLGDKLDLLAMRLAPTHPEKFIDLLTSPRRLLIEVTPSETVASHDSRRLAGDGRGGPAPTREVDGRAAT